MVHDSTTQTLQSLCEGCDAPEGHDLVSIRIEAESIEDLQ